MAKEQGTKPIAQNKKARHDYAIEDKYEAGLVLTGTEVVHHHRPSWGDVA